MFKNKNEIGEKKEKQWWLAYFLLLPSFVLFAIFSYYPLIKTVVNSFAVTDQVGHFIKWAGFSNWQRVLEDTNFGKIMSQTFVFAILNLLLTFFPAMFLALLSTKKQKGAKIYQTLYALPMVIAAASTAAEIHAKYRRAYKSMVRIRCVMARKHIYSTNNGGNYNFLEPYCR